MDGEEEGESGSVTGGEPSLVPTDSIPVGVEPRDLLVVDCDGDGHLDLLIANSGDSTVGVALGNGDGTFAAQQTFAAGSEPSALAAGDLDRDGVLDLAVGNFVDGAGVLFGASGCTFADPIPLFGDDPLGPTSLGANDIDIGDVDADGDPDVIAEMTEDIGIGHFGLFANEGDGTFAPFVAIPSGTNLGRIGIADIDEDGALDLLGVTGFGGIGHDGVLEVVRGLGGGTFAPHQSFALLSEPGAFVVVDVDEDGVLDVASAGGDVGAPSSLSIVRGIGDGTFSPQVTFALDTTRAGASAAGDLDGDGHVDFVIALEMDDAIGVLRGRGDGSFGDVVRITSGASFPRDVDIADLDEDGALDVAVLHWSGSVGVLLAR